MILFKKKKQIAVLQEEVRRLQEWIHNIRIYPVKTIRGVNSNDIIRFKEARDMQFMAHAALMGKTVKELNDEANEAKGGNEKSKIAS